MIRYNYLLIIPYLNSIQSLMYQVFNQSMYQEINEETNQPPIQEFTLSHNQLIYTFNYPIIESQSIKHLRPEQRIAMRVLNDSINKLFMYYCPNIQNIKLYRKDTKVFTHEELRPRLWMRKSGLVWNQCFKKTDITTNNLLIKLNKYGTKNKSRTKRKNTTYKIWTYEIFIINETNRIGTFIWCEKGDYVKISNCSNDNNMQPTRILSDKLTDNILIEDKLPHITLPLPDISYDVFNDTVHDFVNSTTTDLFSDMLAFNR